MKKHTKSFSDLIAFIFILLIIIGIAKLHPQYLSAARTLQSPEFYIYRSVIAMGLIFIGILIERSKLIRGFKVGFKVNVIKFIFSIILLLILFIPINIAMQIISITGFGSIYNITYTITQMGLFRSILGIIAGIALVRSISKEEY